MFSKVESAHYLGLSTYPVDVEIDVVAGLPNFNIVGLPDTAIRESRERVRSAIQNSEFDFPMRKITVNLAPADLKKEGPSFDLPIAIALLKATKQIKKPLDDYCFIGELSLTGQMRPVTGALLVAEQAMKSGKKYLILPNQNTNEAALISGIKILPAQDLYQVVTFLNSDDKSVCRPLRSPKISAKNSLLNLNEVKGQLLAKRALEVAAAGNHNLLMVGSPGAGKSMLAKRFASLIPPLKREQIIEITKIYSVVGLTGNGRAIKTSRPFRAPHHTISSAGLIGGGQYAKPGEISLSHLGVLFLDELTEFNRDVLEALRQPLEEGTVSISRALRRQTYPASFCLIAAMNPCRCGYYGDKVKHCICTPNEIRKYRQKISGPLLDRIDLHINIERLSKEELLYKNRSECSSVIRQRVIKARTIQTERFKKNKINTNSHMESSHLQKHCRLDSPCADFLSKAVDKLGLSARSFDKILRVSRTIADLQNDENIKIEHLAEAIQYRQQDRKNVFL